MSEFELWKIAGYSDCHAAIICLIFSAIWAVIFTFYKTDVKKQIENLKAKNEKLNYISKTQFDAEFKMYQELSEKIFIVLNAISQINKGPNYKVKNYLSVKIEEFEDVLKKSATLNDTLCQYAPFINNNLFEQIELLCNEIKNLFEDTLNYEIINNEVRHTKAEFLLEHYHDETIDIYTQKNNIIRLMREYLQSLKVYED